MPVHIGTYTAHVGMTVIITSLMLPARRPLGHAGGVPRDGRLPAAVPPDACPTRWCAQDPERSLPDAAAGLPPVRAGSGAAGARSAARRRASAGPRRGRRNGRAGGAAAARRSETDEDRLVDVARPLLRDARARRDDAAARRRGDRVRRVASPTCAGCMRENKYSRVPVYGEDLDDIVGVVEVRDLMDFEGPPDGLGQGASCAPSTWCPDTKRIAGAAAGDAGPAHITFAVVIDEYGGTAGIVIGRGHRRGAGGRDQGRVRRRGASRSGGDADGAVVADGPRQRRPPGAGARAALSEPSEEVDTVGGLVTAVFGRIPHAGERTELPRLRCRGGGRRAQAREPRALPAAAVSARRSSRAAERAQSSVPRRLRGGRGPAERGQVHAGQPRWWARRSRSSRTSRRPRATASWRSSTGRAAQIVLFDTPGIHKPEHEMNQRMVDTAVRSVSQGGGGGLAGGGDRAARAGRPLHRATCSKRGTACGAGAQQDRPRRRSRRSCPRIEAWSRVGTSTTSCRSRPRTARTSTDSSRLLVAQLPRGRAALPRGLPDRPARALLRGRDGARADPAPHARGDPVRRRACVIESFKEEAGLVRIHAAILVERDSQKGILIGKGGAMLKRSAPRRASRSRPSSGRRCSWACS